LVIAQAQEQELKAGIEKQKKLALQEKRNENLDKAKQHMAQMKKLQTELDELYSEYPKLKKAAQA
jgi:hypothetical protein